MAALTPDSPTPEPELSTAAAPPGRTSWLSLLILVVAVGLVLYFGVNLIGVLYAIVSPPLPPLPHNVSVIEHDNFDHGVDHWQYATAQDACEVVAFYEDSSGGACVVAPLQCARQQPTDDSFEMSSAMVARCGGRRNFSIFNYEWNAFIMRSDDEQTVIDIEREVYWVGSGPQDE